MDDLLKQLQSDILNLRALEESDAWKKFVTRKEIEIDSTKALLDKEIPEGEMKIGLCTFFRRTADISDGLKKEMEKALKGLPGAELVIKQLNDGTLYYKKCNYTGIGQEFEMNYCENDIERKRLGFLCNLTGNATLQPEKISLPQHLIKEIEEEVEKANQQVEIEEVVEQ